MLREYLRYRKAVLLFYLGALVFFPLVHSLSNLPMASMYYSIVILSFLLAMGLLVDGIRFHQGQKKLAEIKKNLSSYQHILPAPANIIEEKYQEIIAELYRTIEANRFDLENDHAQRVEYYTMWVHQIKTPIAAMRLVLQGGENDPVLEEELFKIERYAEMALQFAKLSSLQGDLVIARHRLEDIIRESVKKYATFFIHKKLSVSIEGTDRFVETDSKWLAFVIEQFLANALKYTSTGGIRIYWEDALIIEDSGMGISAADMERIFEKGYTGYNGRLDKRASGIGLYMAKKVADSLAIQLRITSKVGTGTRAELIFPRRLEMAE